MLRKETTRTHLLSTSSVESLLCGATILDLWYTAEVMQKEAAPLFQPFDPWTCTSHVTPHPSPDFVIVTVWTEACESVSTMGEISFLICKTRV